MLKKISLLVVSLLVWCCSSEPVKEAKVEKQQVSMQVNLDHFNHLYHELAIGNDTLGIVHIYSEFPDYRFEIEPKEGFTCVDDVARAIVMLTHYYQYIGPSPTVLRQIKHMVNFVLYMQNDNGYFNNFMWNDLTINTTYQTTVAELNWWSMRALWALETVLPLMSDDKMAERIKTASARLINNIKRDLPVEDQTLAVASTLNLPTWLPNIYAADQAAILIIGMLPVYERTDDVEVKRIIESMADGIMMMQKGDAEHYPYGVFLSWQNLWHAWGNNQSYALLKAGTMLSKPNYIQSALIEIDHFYPYILKNGFAEAFWIEKQGQDYMETKRNEFPQIAYGIRPMVWACLEAFEITNEKQYVRRAEELQSWMFGNNIANTTMYDGESGRCYDGIISGDEINKNSGAESTIESLLTLIRK